MLAPQIGYGGAEKSFVRLANFLSRYHDVTIALFARGYGTSHYSDAAEITRCPIELLDDVKRGWLMRWVRRWQRFRALKRQSHVAISFLSGPNLLNVACGTGTPSIISERGSKRHNMNLPFLSRFLWLFLLDPLVYRAATFIVPASMGLGKEISEGRQSAVAGRVIPIEGYIDAERLVNSADQIIEPEYEELSRYPTVVTVSRLDRGKGLRFLIDIFSRIKREIPKSRLLIIGDGPIAGELVEHAEKLGLQASNTPSASADVIFAGFKVNPIAYLRVGRVFAFTSRNEGLPNTLIEALASGTPVISADCPWGPRSILAGPEDDASGASDAGPPVELAHGLLLPRLGDEGAQNTWLEALRKLLNMPRPRRTLDERRAAVARFDINNTGKLWLSLIEELVDSDIHSNSEKFSVGERSACNEN
jgi:glycosyltransferase involved in cell wall biosynthesis